MVFNRLVQLFGKLKVADNSQETSGKTAAAVKLGVNRDGPLPSLLALQLLDIFASPPSVATPLKTLFKIICT